MIWKRKKSVAPRARPGITGRPSATFAYYAGDKPAKQDSLRARQASEQRQTFFKRLRLVPTLIALVVILLSIVYSTTLSTDPLIKYAGDTSPYRSTVAYREAVRSILGSSFFNRSKLTINVTATKNKLLQTLPEVDAASIALPIIGRRPTVTLHVREPVLLLSTKTNAFIVGTGGKVVAEAKQLPSSVSESLLAAQDQSGLNVRVGDQALSSSTVSFIQNVQAQLAAKQLSISRLTLLPAGYEIDIYVKGQSYYIKTDSSGDARVQIGAFLAVKDSGVKPAEYIDVRVEDKVFYK